MQRGAGTEEVCREKGWRAGRTGGSGDGLVIKSMGGKRGGRAALGRHRGAQGWATAALSHCIPASGSWAFPQVGTAPGILARHHRDQLSGTPPFSKGAKEAVYPQAALPGESYSVQRSQRLLRRPTKYLCWLPRAGLKFCTPSTLGGKQIQTFS